MHIKSHIHNKIQLKNQIPLLLSLLKSSPCQSVLLWFYLRWTSANSHHPCNFITSVKHCKAQKFMYRSLMKSRWKLYIGNIINISSRIALFFPSLPALSLLIGLSVCLPISPSQVSACSQRKGLYEHGNQMFKKAGDRLAISKTPHPGVWWAGEQVHIKQRRKDHGERRTPQSLL